MKNTFLKKACAVALAAVMAVTFAPVASLNTFAAPNDGIGKMGVVEGIAAEPVKAGSYKIVDSARTADAVTITLDGGQMQRGAYTFDLTGATGEVKFVLKDLNHVMAGENAKKKISINITGKKFTEDLKIQFARVAIDAAGIKSGTDAGEYSLSFDGNLVLDANIDTDFEKDSPLWSAVGSEPVATVGKHLLLGNDAISTYAGIYGVQGDVVAYNGNVEVAVLPAGFSATVAPDVLRYGTSIKAATLKGTALATVKTTVNYSTVYKKAKQYSAPLDRTYVENAYYAGYDRIKDGVRNTPVPCPGYQYKVAPGATRTASAVVLNGVTTTASVKVLDGYSGYVINSQPTKLVKDNDEWLFDVDVDTASIFGNPYYNWAAGKASYEQAITIDKNGEDWTNKTIDNYIADDDTKRDNGGLYKCGLTYYTADPTSFTNSDDGIALIDGNKYIVSDIYPNELTYAVGNATKSVKIMRGAEIDASEGDDYAFEYFASRNDVEVTAPDDMSIVKATQDNVTGRYKWTENQWRVFGTKRLSTAGRYAKVYDFPYKYENENRVNNSIYVAQVASGATLDVYVDPRVTITKADKLGYFTTDAKSAQWNASNDIVGDDWKLATFGEVTPVTKKFVSSVTSKNTEADYYASKEIKTTVKGVDPDVTIKGEVNADVIETVNGKNTWDVNTNAAKEKSQITAHRMYSGREHVYTADPKEIEMLVAAGWKDEGYAFTVNAVASGKGTPIYRVYNKNNGGMHFYTANAAEKDMLLANGWTEGKPVFYGAEKGTGIPVYRTYNTGSNNGEHNYTTNMAEVEMNVQKGWRAEGVAFYVFK